MIREYIESVDNNLFDVIDCNKEQNIYLFIDLKYIASDSANVTLFVQIIDNEYTFALLHYYNSFQLMKLSNNFDIHEISEFLLKYNPVRINATTEIASTLSLNDYSIENGYFMKYIGDTIFKTNVKYSYKWLTTEKDMNDAAEFVCTDYNIGSSNYDVKLLTEQFIKRRKDNCRNLVAVYNGRIIGHVATYAENDKIAVLGGLLVNKDFRNAYIGSSLMNLITDTLFREGKNTYLFSYNDVVTASYCAHGWVVVEKVSKLMAKTK